ncbi:hypothetical protein FB451DRAFT_1188414 [Mycena latifolia]|nr:hypothetical protein FB451DRAFT_1188414 [Mycena latifolia]
MHTTTLLLCLPARRRTAALTVRHHTSEVPVPVPMRQQRPRPWCFTPAPAPALGFDGSREGKGLNINVDARAHELIARNARSWRWNTRWSGRRGARRSRRAPCPWYPTPRGPVSIAPKQEKTARTEEEGGRELRRKDNGNSRGGTQGNPGLILLSAISVASESKLGSSRIKGRGLVWMRGKTGDGAVCCVRGTSWEGIDVGANSGSRGRQRYSGDVLRTPYPAERLEGLIWGDLDSAMGERMNAGDIPTKPYLVFAFSRAGIPLAKEKVYSGEVEKELGIDDEKREGFG